MMEEDLVASLIDSARYNDVEDVIACIEGGASVNGQNESGSTGRCIIYQYLYTHVPIMTSSIHPLYSITHGSSKWSHGIGENSVRKGSGRFLFYYIVLVLDL